MNRTKYVIACGLLVITVVLFVDLGRPFTASPVWIVLRRFDITPVSNVVGLLSTIPVIIFLILLTVVARWLFHDITKWMKTKLPADQ